MNDLPLTGVRVLDLTDGNGEMCGRYLADLGADVALAEPPDGARSRGAAPLHEDRSLYFATHNAGKRGVSLEVLPNLLGRADIVIEPGTLDAAGLLAGHPGLIVVSITDFGLTGPYRDWQATEGVHLALAGVLSRSGLPGRPPLMPPGSPAREAAAICAAWAALLAYAHRLDTGRGEHVDLSVYEATAQAFDPGFGVGGTATGGVPASELPRGRPDARHLYPIVPCADGHVRVCLLSARQWHGMRAWLGEPAELADPSLDELPARYAMADRLNELIGELLAGKTRAEAVEEGQQRGVPIAALLSPRDVLSAGHFAERGALIDLEVAPGITGRAPSGLAEVNGARMGIRRRAPRPGEHTAEVLTEWTPRPVPDKIKPPKRPLAGVRVLDLGVIVVGAELGRLLADQGAEVIKVENRAFPDGARQSMRGETMTPSFAWGHRNKLGFGVDLRDPRGAAVFRRLAAESDIVLSNFKPGAMDALGLGAADLLKLNPRLVVAESSALGGSGPWSHRMGYGPLVRASTGLTWLWRYPGLDDGFSDTLTIYPDHLAARVGAVAVLAALIARRATGLGSVVSVSQAESILVALSDVYLAESLAPGSMAPAAGPGRPPREVYPCAGDDDWCVVTVRDDGDRARLCAAIGREDLVVDPGPHDAAARRAYREEVDHALTAWTAARPALEVMTLLQRAGIPAGMMRRVPELPGDPQLAARGFFRPFRQPQIPYDLLTENGPARFSAIAEPETRPAPMLGEHTRHICAGLLGMGQAEIGELVAAGVLQEDGP